MAFVPLSSGASASDLLRSSCNVSGIPFKLQPTRSMMVGTRWWRDCSAISAKIKKGKKHKYPWPNGPDEIDPNAIPKGGYLNYLSHFNPLAHKPKPVTLFFG